MLETSTQNGKALGGFLVAGAAILGIPLLLNLTSQSRKGKVDYNSIVNIAAASGIANSLPQEEDAFILAAWDWVGRSIEYAPYGSILTFNQDYADCKRCVLPNQLLSMLESKGYGEANCVGKAMLLTSILRNRLPPDRVYMAVGVLNRQGVGGHVWVEVERQDRGWYTLESTIPPPAFSPWLPLEAAHKYYFTEALVNDVGLICYDPSVCVTVEERACDCWQPTTVS